ncbi:hypothetical protein LZ24_01761 [Desulfobotulus alkaliphilus]|uniref:Uncharacterized protein n=2 Tax=Desulfobotulus alkaliphilus TaxID=622671 RepID=A0A562RRM7_9BACT|nr:hypothetical protein LZ24_01761 [Desulfobotulus alkaliphilus]
MKIWRSARDSGGNAYDTGQTMRDEAYLWLDSRWGLCRGCQVWVTKGASTSLPTFSKLGTPLRQITAEELREEAGRQVWVQLRKDNHFLDCECIALAQALWEWPGGGVNFLQNIKGVTPLFALSQSLRDHDAATRPRNRSINKAPASFLVWGFFRVLK